MSWLRFHCDVRVYFVGFPAVCLLGCPSRSLINLSMGVVRCFAAAKVCATEFQMECDGRVLLSVSATFVCAASPLSACCVFVAETTRDSSPEGFAP